MTTENPKILAVVTQFTLEQIDESGSIPKMKDLQPPVVISFRALLPADVSKETIEQTVMELVDRVQDGYGMALEDKWNQ